MTSEEVAEAIRARVTLLLPTGSTEQHGPHLPLGTDALVAHAIASEVARRMGPACVVLPTLPYGFSPHHMSFPGSITIRADIYLGLLGDIVRSLVRHGATDLAIINGHGGNAAPLRMLSAQMSLETGLAPAIVNYWELAADALEATFVEPALTCGHACAMETSLALHLFPDVVRTDRIPRGRSGADRRKYVRPGIFRGFDFGRYSREGVLGEPGLGTAEAGAKLFEVIVTRVVAYLSDSPGAP